MGLIHVMDTQLTNMIAAGEVVDRPVNIVKECVENSLDAGARCIDIEVFEGGIEGVIVTDDGCGMSYEDARMAFERHATSKLSSEDDLFSISTMGFRGEALPSIASVSRVVLTTSNQNKGTRIELEYGEVTTWEHADVPEGTRIEVRGLFTRTPARFKYLKKPSYEFSIISDVVNKLALSHPEIRFTLRHDGRLIFQTSGKGNIQEILFAMFGREVAENAVPFQNAGDDFIISGLAVQPKISRAGKQFIYLSINGRLVRSWNIVKAVIEGYREFLPKDRYPIVYLNVEVDPQLIDVNVHPNKWEVRISKEEFLSQLIINTISALFEEEIQTVQVVAQQPQPEQLQAEFVYPHAIKAHSSAQKEILQTSWNRQDDENHMNEGIRNLPKKEDLFADVRIQDYSRENGNRQKQFMESKEVPVQAVEKERRQQFGGILPQTKTIGTITDSASANETKQNATEKSQIQYPTGIETPKAVDQTSDFRKGKEFFFHLKIIGQLLDSYILCENPEGLVIIDQHAAQERANFERLLKRFEEPVKVLQPLMIPMRIDIPAYLISQIDTINQYTDYYGLHFEPFGSHTVLLRQEPDWLSTVKKEAFLDDLFTYFEKHQKIDMKELRRHMIATMACHSSIRFNRHLCQEEMEKVILDLQACEQPYHCPHGRPTVITMSDGELRKEFERG